MGDMMTPEQRRATLGVLKEIETERIEQHLKWGEQNHPSFPDTPPEDAANAQAIADEARAFCEEAFAKGEGSFMHIFTEETFEAFAEFDDPVALRRELVQVAAVTVAWIEKLDREAKS